MKVALFILAAFLVTASSAVDQGKSQQLMDDIEKQVRLPDGARDLRDYARHYAFSTDGRVIGIYMLAEPPATKAPDYGCEEIIVDGGNFASKPIPCPPEPDTSGQLGAGERRWFDDYRNLPVINDGGCTVVTVLFNPSTHHVEQADCNGVA